MSSTPQPPYRLDDTRAKVLISLYDHTRKAISHYADLEWKVTSYVLAMFSAAIVLAVNGGVISRFGDISKTLFSISAGLLGFISAYFVIFCHVKLTEHRRRRQWLEIIFGFYDVNEFVSLTESAINNLPMRISHMKTVLPADKKTEKITFWVDFLRYTFPALCLIVIVGILVQFLIWWFPRHQ